MQPGPVLPGCVRAPPKPTAALFLTSPACVTCQVNPTFFKPPTHTSCRSAVRVHGDSDPVPPQPPSVAAACVHGDSDPVPAPPPLLQLRMSMVSQILSQATTLLRHASNYQQLKDRLAKRQLFEASLDPERAMTEGVSGEGGGA